MFPFACNSDSFDFRAFCWMNFNIIEKAKIPKM